MFAALRLTMGAVLGVVDREGKTGPGKEGTHQTNLAKLKNYLLWELNTSKSLRKDGRSSRSLSSAKRATLKTQPALLCFCFCFGRTELPQHWQPSHDGNPFLKQNIFPSFQ